jgi:hypothetical protein
LVPKSVRTSGKRCTPAKVVQRVLRHAKPHITKERHLKAFDPAVLAAMKILEATLDDFHKCSAAVQQVN